MQLMTIFGPPGTGKTRTMVEFAKGEDGGLFLSYTRAAATEAVSRLQHDGIRPSTLHSLAFNALGMSRASVVDRAKLKQFAAATGIPFKGQDGTDEEQEGDQYVETQQFSRNAEVPVMEAYDRFGQPGTRHRFEIFIREYEAWKQSYGYMDFDDMLTLYTRKIKHVNAPAVFLDEAQDCTPLQWRAFNTAISGARRVFIAGDDDQAIYEWSGADPHGMINFTKANDGEYNVLAQSHRLPRSVHKLATKLVASLGQRVDKTFRPAEREGSVTQYRDLDFVLDRLDDIAPKGALILVRDRFRLEETKRSLNRQGVAYDVYGGISPWTSKIAKAIQAGELVRTSQDIPPAWRSFYRHADLAQSIRFHLSTIHQAKGREHDTVIHDMDCPTRVLANIAKDRDAEVRVQYVAMTRAKDKLILCGTNPLV